MTSFSNPKSPAAPGVLDAQLVTQRLGSGPALVWSHGLLGSMALEDTIGIFSWPTLANHLTVLRYDARGHGLSSAAPLRPLTAEQAAIAYTWPQLADDMLRVTTQQALPSFVAGGQSMGAATALYAAIAAPQRVRGLILTTPPVGWQARVVRAALYRDIIAVLEQRGSRLLKLLMKNQPALPPWLSTTLPHYQEAVVDALQPMSDATLIAIYRGAQHSDYPTADVLRQLNVPCLILAWSDDPVHPVATAQQLAQWLPQAELVVAQRYDAVTTWPERIVNFLRAHAR